ncbi:chalcone-flavanone isomerase-domain-containing protein [Coprinopsis sp. MPI-PUGE-AT-0042]|nr:chalcone-flavanone isomerase-domain-containing protein [Coprinopsis sp. MPI-PUGE-AT-0042]
MSLLLRTLATARSACWRNSVSSTSKRPFSSGSTSGTRSYRSVVCAVGFGAAVASTAAWSQSTVNLDADANVPFVVDPATSIEFPKTITVPAKTKIPPLSLVGLGVRTVSFLGIKVYSVGFYADLDNPNLKVPQDLTPEEKVKVIVKNTACVIRIVPTRSTSFTHLRDAFMRALQGRLVIAKKEGTITEEQENDAGSPMRKLKSMFPNSPLAKHTPMDMYLSGPVPGRPRSLALRDLGSIENDWVATELVLHYFEGDGPSPPLKKSVLEALKDFSK